MIDKNVIYDLIEKELADSQMFAVDVKVSSSNKITVYLDSVEGGVTIKDCAAISRMIESNLDRDVEDYELEVSSYGLTHPFIDIRQYQKNLGKQIDVLTADNEKLKGILTNVKQDEISLELDLTKKQIKEGKEKNIQLKINQIKEAKIIISFK